MTLQEQLSEYKAKNNLNNTEIARKLQITRPQVRNILNGKSTTGKTIEKMVSVFGSEFEPFLERRVCKCGKEFVPKTYNQNCCSDECSWKYNGKSRKKREDKPVMTLSEHLKNYMQKYQLTGAETAQRMGLNGQQISMVRLHNKYSQITAEKICKVLGLNFTDYFKYSTCPICGDQYIKFTSIQATCSKHECREAHRVAKVLECDADIRSGKRVRERHYKARVSTRRTVPKVEAVKPDISYVEYENKARSQGLSYGQLQGLERLGVR